MIRERLGDFWRRRSWKGKTALIIGAILLVFIAIGYAAPAEEETASETGAATDEPTATEAAETTPPAPETTTEPMDECPNLSGVQEAPPPGYRRRQGRCVEVGTVAVVVDGDTIELDDGRTIRLVQIDAPRRGGCYARQATRTLRRLAPPGTELRLERDPRLDDVDRFDRELRYAFAGRRHVNLVLVRRGAASVWYFQGDRGRHASTLLQATRRARAASRGAWGDCLASLRPTRPFATRPKPPPPTPEPEPAPSNCHPSYRGACLNPNSPDYDCAGGSGNGPDYTGTVSVVGYDEYGLDGDGDGVGCE